MKKEQTIIELLKEIKGIELGKVHYRNIMLDLKRLYKEREAFEDLLDIKLERLRESESSNLISLFNKMVGRHTKVLEMHRQEYLRVTLEYNEVTKSVSLLEYEKKLKGIQNSKPETLNL